MMDIIESHKCVYEVVSTKSGNEYSLIIIKEKAEDVYRIVNLTKGHICPCKFSTYEEAEDDIYRYQSEGKNEILGMHSIVL